MTTAERIERVLGGLPNAQPAATDALLEIVKDEVAAERKRCACIAEGFARANINLNPNEDEATVASSVAQAIANQIRATLGQ